MKLFLPYFKRWAPFLSLYLAFETLLVLAAIALFGRGGWSFSELGWSPLLLLPLALFLAVKLPSMMHNAFHWNFKRANLLIGEITSFFVLMSFGIMCINHAFHHAHADTDRDPHSPNEKSFLMFFLTAIFTGVATIESAFLQRHGNTLRNRLLFKLNIVLHHLGIALRLILIALVLGENYFLALYVPAFLFYLFTFAHVNYYTHRKSADQGWEVINLNHHLWHKLINSIGDGIYFHKNHHENPKLFNPMREQV